MAKCQYCGKKTTFGRNRPWSKKATPRTFRPNLQKITVYEDGRKSRKVLCTKCIRTLVKTNQYIKGQSDPKVIIRSIICQNRGLAAILLFVGWV